MGLYDIWNGTVVLPALPMRKLKIGKNTVFQQVFPMVETYASLSESQMHGYYSLRTKLGVPFDEILLRKKRFRKQTSALPTATSQDIDDLDKIPKKIRIDWEDLSALDSYADTPDKVRENWTNKFQFKEENEEKGLRGLRTPQVAALHAISAHFGVGSDFETATVVLPTGTGKTETMLSTTVYRRLKRVLVVVPSTALRSQIAQKFLTLGVLPDAGVVPREIARPRVAVLSSGVASIEHAKEICSAANVIVALPNVIEASANEAVDQIIEACTDLIVDEAHHVTAKTWGKIREKFEDGRTLQFTATPFRRDGKKVDGKIIFNYKLGDAQKAGYYKPINLRAIEEYGDQDDRDRAIALAALADLDRDRNELGLDHILMARTNIKDRAIAIHQLYQELSPHNKPVVVYSGSGRTVANNKALESLRNRNGDVSNIVVCVDMLGEGVDIPNLKIAALHDTHKSLAVTLQFVGRFTRKGDESQIGEATVVTNIAEKEAEDKLGELYAEGADWDKIIKRLSEDRIDEELQLQEVVEKLRGAGSLHSQLSLWNLTPPLSGQFFRTNCAAWTPSNYKNVLPPDAESWYSLDSENCVLVAVVCWSKRIKWGNYQDIADTIYDLLLVKWDRENQVLCLYASNFDALKSEKLAQELTSEETSLVNGDPIFRVLNNVEMPLAKSLGTSRIGAVSFTSYFGSNVTEGIASIEKTESALNNLACLGYKNGEKVLWGGAQRRGKIWQHTKGTISEWLEWAKMTWGKVSSEDEPVSNIIRDFLRPEKLDIPHPSEPIAVQWGELAQTRRSDKLIVIFAGTEIPSCFVTLDFIEKDESGVVRFRLSSETHSSEYALIISSTKPGGYAYEHISGDQVRIEYGRNPSVPLEEYLIKDPFIIRYADGTHSYNCYHIPVSLNAGAYSRDELEIWDWTGIPLNRESMGKAAERDTIQYRSFERLSDEFDVIFNDDGKGEAADLVCLRDGADENSIRLCLVHCKGAYDGRVTGSIQNFYEVCGQAQKSITAKHMGLQRLYLDLRRREETWLREGKSRFLKGDMKRLTYFRDKSRRASLEFELIIVQPGAAARTVSDDILRLLATTELYLTKTTEAIFRVAVSE